MIGAVGVLGLPAVVLLRDLAPGDALDIDKLAHTLWKPEMRLVRDVVGTPILASEPAAPGLLAVAAEVPLVVAILLVSSLESVLTTASPSASSWPRWVR